MVLNVYFVIIPGQRELVKAKQEGRVPDPKYGLMGRQRSVHNTYFTLPVLFTMISNHYAGLYGHEWNWVLLIMISVAGALIRVWFVQRHKGKQTRWCWPRAWSMLALTALVSLPRPTVDIGPPASFAEVQPVFQARCQPCHATRPTQEGFAAPPKGVLLETEAEIRARAPMINQQAWVIPGHAARQPDPHHRRRAPPDCALVQGRRTIDGHDPRCSRIGRPAAVAPPAHGGAGRGRDLCLLDPRRRARRARRRARRRRAAPRRRAARRKAGARASASSTSAGSRSTTTSTARSSAASPSRTTCARRSCCAMPRSAGRCSRRCGRRRHHALRPPDRRLHRLQSATARSAPSSSRNDGERYYRRQAERGRRMNSHPCRPGPPDVGRAARPDRPVGRRSPPISSARTTRSTSTTGATTSTCAS